MEDTSTVEDKVASSASERTEEPEWLIPKQQMQSNDDIDTNSGITTSLFSTGKTSTTVASKAPLIVDLNENLNTGNAPDFAQGKSLSELMLPLEITPSSSNKTVGRRPLIEEIDDTTSDDYTDLLVDSCNKVGGPTSFFMTESNVSKAASFYSTTSEEPESTPTEFGGQWAERTRPLIEEVEGDNPEMAKVEDIEDLEDIETPLLPSKGDQSAGNSKASQPVDDNGEGEIDRITELAEKAGSTLDPVTMDQALLQSLRQKYQ